MNGRWQITTHVEPISLEPESIHGDVVQQPTNQPVRNQAIARTGAVFLSIAAPVLAFVNIFPEPVEQITQDKWAQPQSQPQFSVKPIVAEGIRVDDPARLLDHERIDLDKWAQPIQQPVLTIKFPIGEGQRVYDAFGFTQPERASQDKWGQPQSQPYLTLKYSPSVGWSTVDPQQLAQPEVTTQSRWAQPQSQPFPARGNPFHSGWSVNDPLALTQVETTQIDKWFRETSQPVWDVARQQRIYPSFFSDSQLFTVPGIEAITLDKWRGYQPEHIYQLGRLSNYGSFEIDPLALTQIEQTQLDKWWPGINQPYPLQRLSPTVGCFTIDSNALAQQVEAITPDKWQAIWPQPYPTRSLPAAQGIVAVDPQLLTQVEAVSLDRFYILHSQPRFDVKQWQFLYPALFPDARLYQVPAVVVRVPEAFIGSAAVITQTVVVSPEIGAAFIADQVAAPGCSTAILALSISNPGFGIGSVPQLVLEPFSISLIVSSLQQSIVGVGQLSDFILPPGVGGAIIS